MSTLHEDSERVDIDPRLHAEEDNHVLDRRQASTYHETEIDSMLTGLGVDTAVITDCTTSGCIRASAVDACSHGYYTVVPEEAVGARAVEPHDANLFDINGKYGDIRPVSEVASYLADAGHYFPRIVRHTRRGYMTRTHTFI